MNLSFFRCILLFRMFRKPWSHIANKTYIEACDCTLVNLSWSTCCWCHWSTRSGYFLRLRWCFPRDQALRLCSIDFRHGKGKGLSTGSELQWGNWVQHEFQLQAAVVPTRKIILKLPKGQRKRTTTKTKRRLFIAYKHNVIWTGTGGRRKMRSRLFSCNLKRGNIKKRKGENLVPFE